VKKVFQLTDPKKKPARVLEAIKHEIRKYVKREKRKELADPETTYWDFDCQIGSTAEEAKEIVYAELFTALDTIESTDATQVYIEIMVKTVLKPVKPISEESDVKESATKEPTIEEPTTKEPTD